MKQHLAIFYFGICTILILSNTVDSIPAPYPSCRSDSQSLKKIPISPSEIQIQNLNHIFKGYNLQYSLDMLTPDFITIKNKRELLQQLSLTLPGLISYKFDHIDNQWSNFITILRKNQNKITVEWSNYDSKLTNLSIPVIVSENSSVTCFDTQFIKQKNIILVDCSQQLQFQTVDIIFYVDVASKSVIQQYSMQTIIQNQFNPRKIYHYIDPISKFSYLIRVVFSSDKKQDNYDNTYVQIMSINKDKFLAPQTLSLIDRSLLNKDTLKIMDFKIYRNTLYFLDYDYGLYAVTILRSQDIQIQMSYSLGKKSLLFALFQESHDHLVCALLTTSAIYEIDLSDNQKLLNKYHFLDEPAGKSIWMTRTHVVIAVNTHFNQSPFNSALIFDRSNPTLIYGVSDVIPFSGQTFFIDMDTENNKILTVDPSGINIYQINLPQLLIFPVDDSLINYNYTFHVTAKSSDPWEQRSIICQKDYFVRVVDSQSYEIWPSETLPHQYHINYPGQLSIDLSKLAKGANIQWLASANISINSQKIYSIESNASSAWVFKQNSSQYIGLQQFQPNHITFMTQNFFLDSIVTYIQDSQSNMYFLECRVFFHDEENNQIPCFSRKLQIPQFQQTNIELHSHIDYESAHADLFVTDKAHNVVLIYTSYRDQVTDLITLEDESEDPYNTYISGIMVSGKYLFVTLKYIKTLMVYDISRCAIYSSQQCKLLYTIDSTSMEKAGINYFQPLSLQISNDYPSMVFIQNIDSVIVLSFDDTGYSVLEELPIQDSKSNWKIRTVEDYLIIVTPPHSIEQHQIFQNQQKSVIMTKDLQTYSYSIPDDYQIKVGEEGTLFFINAIEDETNKKVLLMYKLSEPKFSALYDIYPMNDNTTLFEAVNDEGTYFITTTDSKNLKVFREFQTPILKLQNFQLDTEFSISYMNKASSKSSLNSSLKVNLNSQEIDPNPDILNDTDFLTNQILYKNKTLSVQLDDSDWFTGHVSNYSVTGCSDCGDKINIAGHFQEVMRSPMKKVDTRDSVSTPMGNYLLYYQAQAALHPNNTIKNIVTVPAQEISQMCVSIEASNQANLLVTGCDSFNLFNIYCTDLQAFKPFPRGPYHTRVQYFRKAMTKEHLLFILDSKLIELSEKESRIFIYHLTPNTIQPNTQLPQVEIIDRIDLMSTGNFEQNSNLKIVDFDVEYFESTHTYMLVIATADQGVFHINFMLDESRQDVHITGISFSNIFDILTKSGFAPPNTIVNSLVISENSQTQMQYFIGFKQFNIFQIECFFDQSGIVISAGINAYFRQYGPYQNSEKVQVNGDYLAVIQKLPLYYQTSKYDKTVLSVYKIAKASRKQLEKVPAIYLQSSSALINNYYSNFFFDVMQKKGTLAVFDYNFVYTYNINDKITLRLDSNLQSHQSPSLQANNQFNNYKIGFKIPFLKYQRVKMTRGYAIKKLKDQSIKRDQYSRMNEILINSNRRMH